MEKVEVGREGVAVTWTLGETRDENERLVGREGDIVTGLVGEVNEEISL